MSDSVQRGNLMVFYRFIYFTELESSTCTGKTLTHHSQCSDPIDMQVLGTKHADLNTNCQSISSCLLECHLIGFAWISEARMRRMGSHM